MRTKVVLLLLVSGGLVVALGISCLPPLTLPGIGDLQALLNTFVGAGTTSGT